MKESKNLKELIVGIAPDNGIVISLPVGQTCKDLFLKLIPAETPSLYCVLAPL